ncbi:DUF4446 family protein [Alkaliphilus transvaalensis]|uniref:DUF4446 family protein n=1 Tax=Alkaliphilus transvaalensis TaxID=114628 RepID=UPI00047B6754|nr:DUF4446 family protein [Alkaliphilus transvaalensis]
MESVLLFVEEFSVPIIMASVIINIILVFLMVINYGITSNLKDKYKRLVKGTSGKNIEAILMEHLDKVENTHEEMKSLYRKFDILENRISFCIQKVGIIRYNAFQDTGSDLSFSIALLNESNDGIILTGIHGRNESMSYAKPIKNGKSNYSLSVEELQALDRAKSNKLDHLEVQGSRNNKEVI